ncbi:hypothetical protein [Microseira wollei]|uniref:Uncharacterized protein n=1 Tax=Microseira wollei NIES-4236 TaxID=2530354 RepID=A0AAV3XGC0_9CYAN|nr:hypothetical protein [Microseira wollei]GET41449.1 hypothetical protein MiSe_62610 [Microseira wollei NIES-4236]
MQTNFLTDTEENPDVRVSIDTSERRSSNRESVRVLLIGSRLGVIRTIHKFYRLKVAEVGDWSALQPGRKPGEFMSILTLHFATN